LIIVGAIGLAVYLLYMWNLNNIILHYALLVLIITGGFLALILAVLYLTKGVEPQVGIE